MVGYVVLRRQCSPDLLAGLSTTNLWLAISSEVNAMAMSDSDSLVLLPCDALRIRHMQVPTVPKYRAPRVVNGRPRTRMFSYCHDITNSGHTPER